MVIKKSKNKDFEFPARGHPRLKHMAVSSPWAVQWTQYGFKARSSVCEAIHVLHHSLSLGFRSRRHSNESFGVVRGPKHPSGKKFFISVFFHLEKSARWGGTPLVSPPLRQKCTCLKRNMKVRLEKGHTGTEMPGAFCLRKKKGMVRGPDGPRACTAPLDTSRAQGKEKRSIVVVFATTFRVRTTSVSDTSTHQV